MKRWWMAAALAAVMMAGCVTVQAPMPPASPGHDYERQHRESDKAFEELGRNEMELQQPAARPAVSSPAAAAEQKAGIPRGGQMPIWVRDPHYDGRIGAVGIAPPQGARGGIGVQREAAIAMAQAKLAEQLRVLVRSSTEIGRIVHDDGMRQRYERWIRKLSEHETEAVAQRAAVADEWIDDQGVLYIRLVLLPEDR